MNLSRLKISTRLFLAFGAVVLLAVISSGMALFELKGIQTSMDDIVLDNNAKITLINDQINAVNVVTRITRNLILLTDESERAEERRKLNLERANYDQAHDKLAKFPASGAGMQKRAAIDAAASTARALDNKVIESVLASQIQQSITLLMKEAAPATAVWQAALVDNLRFQEANNLKEYQDALVAYGVARNTLILSALVSLLVAVLLAVWVVRSITGQIGGEPADVAQLANAIADADLSSAIAVRPGDTTSVVAAMARMQQALTTIVGSVRGNADSVSTASAEIAQGNNDLSSRTEQQASALEETAASMEQLGATVRQNADNARQANQLALSASSVAVQGGEVVGLVVETMKGINDSSRKISDIIQVIDGIAFQTNILALNAAVEAARAGEQGRGFAVVASEVRSLAGRSADAAKEIKSLINASVERVEQGSALVDQAGATMTEVVGSIRRVTDIMGEISAASNEQSLGVSQIGEAVTQMDQVTQQNAALVEEMAAAASSLKSQAQDLVQTVSVFKLGGHAAHHVARAAAPAGYSRPAPPRATLPRPAVPKLRTTPTASRPATAPTSLPSPKAPMSKIAAAPATSQSNDADWETF
jgi:methyl-accepting chemotaxis protein